MSPSRSRPSRGIRFSALLAVALGGCGDRNDDFGDGGSTTQNSDSAGAAGSGVVASSSGAESTGAENTASETTGSITGTTSDGSPTTTSGVSTSTGGAQGTTGAEMGSVGGGTTTGGAAGSANGGATTSGGGAATSTDGAGGADNPGPCTESQAANSNASGSGPHEVTVETNSDPGIDEGTIFRPTDLGGGERYPILVWGEGACSQDGLSNAAAMAEIASHGYFVVADGTPGGSGNREMDRSNLEAMAAPLIAYIDWAITENAKPCSAYYHSLYTTKIAANGFSCGGLMSQATAGDPRIVTWGVTSSGMAGANQQFYDLIDTPVLFVEGGPAEVAYDGGLEGYEAISQLGVPVLWFSKDLGHGGDLFTSNGGDFTRINLAWLNWWLKGDETATGKGLLLGAECPYCSDNAWEVMSANVP